MTNAEAIRAVIQKQAEAWNQGDLEGFVRHVADDVIYVTPRGMVRGREALLEAYRGDWRDRPGGNLTVSVEEIIEHGPTATVIVRFWLSGSRRDRSGWSLLTFIQNDDGWALFADATMRSADTD